MSTLERRHEAIVTLRAPLLLRAIVAIPVCNEEAFVAGCLLALARQDVTSARFGIVLFVNNTGDRTCEVVRRCLPRLTYPVRLVEDPLRTAPNAGRARRAAMDLAAAWFAEEGAGDSAVILTTDADTVVPPDWVARNLAAIEAGADAVAGSIRLDPDDAARLPVALRRRGAREDRYDKLLVEIASRLAPVPGDPWPRHRTNSGATFAVTLDAYRRVGGMPALPVGEDRAFAAALAAAGARVRHDPAIEVVTSGRLVGRAVGGAADTMRMRADHPDAPCDEALEPVARLLARQMLPGLRLAATPLRPDRLPVQIGLARMVVAALRLRDRVRAFAGRRAGTRARDATAPDRSAPRPHLPAPR